MREQSWGLARWAERNVERAEVTLESPLLEIVHADWCPGGPQAPHRSSTQRQFFGHYILVFARWDEVASLARNQRRKGKFSTSSPVRCTACGQRLWEINCTVNLEKSIWVYSVELCFTAWLKPSEPKTLSWPFCLTDATDTAGCQCNVAWPLILLNHISDECLPSIHIGYMSSRNPDRLFKCPERKPSARNIIKSNQWSILPVQNRLSNIAMGS